MTIIIDVIKYIFNNKKGVPLGKIKLKVKRETNTQFIKTRIYWKTLRIKKSQ